MNSRHSGAAETVDQNGPVAMNWTFWWSLGGPAPANPAWVAASATAG